MGKSLVCGEAHISPEKGDDWEAEWTVDELSPGHSLSLLNYVDCANSQPELKAIVLQTSL